VSAHLDITLLLFGALLVLGALASGIARRSMVSLTALFVLAGFALGRGGIGALHFQARSPFVDDLAVVALIVILFSDGLAVDAELLQTHWHLPLRKLLLAMPLTLGIVAAGAKLLTNLGWLECLLLGALLSPTDPVLTSTVISNSRVPNVIRHSLNLESGLNDGLALPAVLAFAAALTPGGGHFVWWRFVLEDLVAALATGLVVGALAARLMPREEGLGPEIPGHQKSLYALGAAFACYGIAVLPPHGNGLIAVYVGAITLGIMRPDLRAHFARQAADLVEIVKLGVFVVFGSVLTVHGLFGDGWAAVGVVAITLLLARPVAVSAALIKTGTDVPTRAFMAWFGPKGVATMTFALFVLSDHIASGIRIFNLAALVVLTSVIVHGVSDTPGAEWIARRAEEASAAGGARRAALSGPPPSQEPAAR
jgi:NhaP-type Na+/H+ or K+/H+ antiporter